MAFDQNNRQRNENLKFVETSGGDTAVRVSLVDGVTLSAGTSFEIYDHRGFLVFAVTDQGDIKRKGSDIKL